MRILHTVAFALGIAAVGCAHKPPPVTPAPPVVMISQLVKSDVTDYVEFNGTTESIHSIDVKPKVSGYIVKVGFKDGAFVKQGDLLFQIDPRPFQADLDKAKGEVERFLGQKMLLDIQVDRFTKLVSKGAGSQEDLDKYKGQQAENLGALKSARAAADLAQLNLDFCHMTAPIDGKISRAFLREGNLVTMNETTLTTIASVDPMFVYFNVDERTLLRVRRLMLDGKIKATESNYPVLMGLDDEEGFPHKGTVDFVNNIVNRTTGTISVRGTFANPETLSTRLLSPGMNTRIKLPLGYPHPALLVAERAIGTDQGQKFLYVVDAQNVVQYRPVRLGSLQDGLRVVEPTRMKLKDQEIDSIHEGDWVIVNGLQRVRPGMTVEPQRVPMPVFTGPRSQPQPAGKEKD